jgi:cellulose synthase/poly-beta-1,6-N-acetylglucosamine synthase-like glycosyltransferase
MQPLEILWIFVQGLIGYNLVFPLFLLAIYGIRTAIFSHEKKPVAEQLPDYAIIVTAYEQTQQLPATISSLLAVNYPNYHIYVVADKCDITNLDFGSDKVSLLRPEQVLASNTRSHFYAIRHFIRPHSHLTIIDSDNLTDPEYLAELTRYFNRGYVAVQGIRKAKNLDSMYARLDAARDLYYHFYDGKILFGAGSSATLAGSGMAFTTALYRQCLEHQDVTGAGFDKVLQEAIVSHGHRICFADKAIVYDEKTTQSDQLVNQRARWINTWFKYFSLGFSLILKGFVRLDLNQLLFGFVLLRPPLFIFLILSLFFCFLNLFISIPMAVLWAVGLSLFALGFFISLAKSDADPRIYSSLAGIPKFVFYQLSALSKVGKANKISVATKHGPPKSSGTNQTGT